MSKRKKSSVNQVRTVAHWVKVGAGDVRAVQTGRIGQRVANRVMGKIVGRAMRKLWF